MFKCSRIPSVFSQELLKSLKGVGKDIDARQIHSTCQQLLPVVESCIKQNQKNNMDIMQSIFSRIKASSDHTFDERRISARSRKLQRRRHIAPLD